MKRRADEDDEDEEEDQRAPKRTRPSDRALNDFLDRQHQQPFRDAHHPERVVAALLEKRELATAALASFVSDLKAGALTGPRLASAGLLKDLPLEDPAASPEHGATPNSSHMANLEPLPSAAMSLARAVLCAAGAGPASASSAGGDAESAGLVSLLFAEPINHKTRIWAAYDSRPAAESGARAFRSLPQISELIDPPQALRAALMPTREARPPALTDDALAAHIARCDELISAIETRLGLSGQASVLSADAIRALPSRPELSAEEQLQLRVLYLRRVHHFDYMGGGPFASQTSMLEQRGEAHFPMGVVIHASRDPLAAPVRDAAIASPRLMRPALPALPASRLLAR